MNVERRRHLRHRIYTLAYFTFNGAAAGTILDMSEAGMAVQTGFPVAVGASKQLGFLLDHNQKIECLAEVVWVGSHSRTGLCFRHISPDAQQLLVQWFAQVGGPVHTNPMVKPGSDASACFPSFDLAEESERWGLTGLGKGLVAIFFAALLLFIAGMWVAQKRDVQAQPEVAVADPSDVSNMSPLAVPSAAAATNLDLQSPLKPAPPVPRSLVSDVRFLPRSQAAQLVVTLNANCRYQAHRLHSPERLYFDLFNSDPSAAVLQKRFESLDSRVRGIRVGKPANGLTRIVLETNGAVAYRASLAEKPYRLVVDITRQ